MIGPPHETKGSQYTMVGHVGHGSWVGHGGMEVAHACKTHVNPEVEWVSRPANGRRLEKLWSWT